MLVRTHKITARIQPFPLTTARESPWARASVKKRLLAATERPAAAMRPVEAGRRP